MEYTVGTDEHGNLTITIEKDDNEITLDLQELNMLAQEVDRMYYRQDVTHEIENRIKDDLLPERTLKNKEFIDDVYEEYKDMREYSDITDWQVCMSEAFDKVRYSDYEPAYKLPDGVYETIYNMGANEKLHLDNFSLASNIVLEITKDSDYDKNQNIVIMDMDGKDYMNLVKVDFMVEGKSIATTYDIHVSELEKTLTEILNDEFEALIDETRPLSEIYWDAFDIKPKQQITERE